LFIPKNIYFPNSTNKTLNRIFCSAQIHLFEGKNIFKINGERGGVNKIFTPVLNIMKLNYSKLAKVPGVARGIFKIQLRKKIDLCMNKISI